MQAIELKYNEQGLIACIVQDVDSCAVLMMAWMNEEALRLTLEQRSMWFWSRSRNELWHKGATSKNTQELVELRYDCDADTLLALVKPQGPACHTGEVSCFFRTLS
ncbi:MAG: phosphoribosyl-AMP cyclohydrolase [Eggerthellaceae bacterium]|nr:phosphoribosyl-AMP cyclohydrolase [Eggerthellaceae bacterium]